MSSMPRVFGKPFQSASDGSTTSADGDKRDVSLVEPRQFFIAGEFRIEAEPVRIAAGNLVPEFDKVAYLASLVGACEIGIAVAQNLAFLLLCEECEHAG